MESTPHASLSTKLPTRARLEPGKVEMIAQSSAPRGLPGCLTQEDAPLQHPTGFGRLLGTDDLACVRLGSQVGSQAAVPRTNGEVTPHPLQWVGGGKGAGPVEV